MTAQSDTTHNSFPPAGAVGHTYQAGDDFFLRPYGIEEADLAVNFRQLARPHLVTELLWRCATDKSGAPIEPEFWWNLAVGKRIEYLLQLLVVSGCVGLPLTIRCRNAACAQELEAELSVPELTMLQQQADVRDGCTVQCGEQRLALRKPTARDQKAWLAQTFRNQEEAIGAMIRTLRITESSLAAPLPWERAWLAALEQAMDECDPLVSFTLEIHCSDCGAAYQYEVDLEAYALHYLQAAQAKLLLTVHRLASHYHWSEPQVFAVPPWRRAYYLALLAKETAQ